jgi:hypothetical protein
LKISFEVKSIEEMSQRVFKAKTVPIISDYRITDKVLGLGINGKVVECWDKTTGQKFALKVTSNFILFHFLSFVFTYFLSFSLTFQLITNSFFSPLFVLTFFY